MRRIALLAVLGAVTAACSGSTSGDDVPDASVPWQPGLGAHWDPDGSGVEFRIASTRATRIELWIYDAPMGSAERSRVVMEREVDGQLFAFPDTVFGTDSHTTMINGIGVLGWGVGGIEAEAAMLGQPSSMLIPQVVGFELTGKLPEGATATDLVLTVTQMLRKHGVVGKFVEFYGAGLDNLPLADRATIANMAPEYGATCGIFPIDAEAVNYLHLSGRPQAQIDLVEAYAKAQGLWREPGEGSSADFSSTLQLDMAEVKPSTKMVAA